MNTCEGCVTRAKEIAAMTGTTANWRRYMPTGDQHLMHPGDILVEADPTMRIRMIMLLSVVAVLAAFASGLVLGGVL